MSTNKWTPKMGERVVVTDKAVLSAWSHIGKTGVVASAPSGPFRLFAVALDTGGTFNFWPSELAPIEMAEERCPACNGEGYVSYMYPDGNELVSPCTCGDELAPIETEETDE